MGARIEPGGAAAHDFYMQVTALQVGEINVGDFQLIAGRGAYGAGDIHHIVVVKIQSRYRVVGARIFRLFFDIARHAFAVKIHHAVALRVIHIVGKYRGALVPGGGVAQAFGKAIAIEDVISQHQAYGGVADKISAQEKCLGKAVGARLHRIADVDAPLLAAAQKIGKGQLIPRRGDNEDVANARFHERRQRVVDHGFVVHGH